ncbi:MAG: tRNA pseudouridine(38-40) synthase TruA [Clostridia bacterium]|nr:tRNA pseudouridine(38-40) synthase TruA [Clostridia bacterium]
MRLKVEFSYLGENYFGYQVQDGVRTVQGDIEKVLSDFFDTDISFVASGRTDTGVSAIRQVGHFDIKDDVLLAKIKNDSAKEFESLVIRINYLLDKDIRFLHVSKASEDYHARFNAKKKTYFYNLYSSKTEIPYFSQFALWVKYNLDINKIRDAIKAFVGTHDFTAFCASGSEVQDKVRTIYEAELIENEMGYITLKFVGNGFLYNMIRIMVGTMIEVGRGKLTKDDITKIIENKDRTLAGKTVSAIGLVLGSVEN